MSFWPKVVDWACSLRPSKKRVFEEQTRALNAPDTNVCNRSRGATKWHETIQNMSFRPKVVDWACLLQKTRNRSRGINSCIKCTSIPIFASCQVWLRNGIEPPKTWVLDLKLWVGCDKIRNGFGGINSCIKCTLLTLLSVPIYVPQAHGSCSFSLRVFPQGLSIHGTSVLLCLTKH